MAEKVGNGHLGEERAPEAIRAEIERARREIASSMMALSAEVSARMDWREWVGRRPALSLGAAFLLGVWLGTRR